MTRHELLSLQNACRDDPEDDAPRRVLADWFDGHASASDRARKRRSSRRYSTG